MTEETKTTKLPTHTAYMVREGKKDKSYWTRIGAAWTHNDGKGFSIMFDAVPLDGKMTLRIVSEKKDD